MNTLHTRAVPRPMRFGLAVVLIVAVGAASRGWADPILNPANGHYYAMVDGAYDWYSANAAAAATTFKTASGHLVTITDAQENLFLTNTFGDGLAMHWIGGKLFFPPIVPITPGGPPPLAPPPTGSWVTGEPFSYTNWAPGSLLYLPAGLARVAFGSGTSGDGEVWVDRFGSAPASGYVVEFDNVPANPPPPDPNPTPTPTPTPTPEPVTTPEPASLSMAAVGGLTLAGFGWMRRRRTAMVAAKD